MPNVLVLKTFAWNENERNFYSPSRSDFLWGTDVIYASCEKCAPEGTIGLKCTCGIYGSPNWECIEEYHVFPNSVMILANTYGRLDIWSGPPDLAQYRVIRCLGMQVVGIIKPDQQRDKKYYKQRVQVALLAADKFDIEILSLGLAKEMMQVTWKQQADIDPFKGEI